MNDKRNRVLIEYPDGQRYTVTDAAFARRKHADATVTRYADGRAFDADTDPSLLALTAAESIADAVVTLEIEPAAESDNRIRKPRRPVATVAVGATDVDATAE